MINNKNLIYKKALYSVKLYSYHMQWTAEDENERQKCVAYREVKSYKIFV